VWVCWRSRRHARQSRVSCAPFLVSSSSPNDTPFPVSLSLSLALSLSLSSSSLSWPPPSPRRRPARPLAVAARQPARSPRSRLASRLPGKSEKRGRAGRASSRPSDVRERELGAALAHLSRLPGPSPTPPGHAPCVQDSTCKQTARTHNTRLLTGPPRRSPAAPRRSPPRLASAPRPPPLWPRPRPWRRSCLIAMVRAHEWGVVCLGIGPWGP